MATSLQVNASTAQAVGAFDRLATAIANTERQFNRLSTTMGRGAGGATRYSGAVTSINTAFSRLQDMIGSVINGITVFGAGLGFVFKSIIKELDKLQGFQAIMSVTTKSATAVGESYDFLRGVAHKLGVQFDSLTSNYAKLVAALPAGAEGLDTARRVFLGVANAARTLHATNPDTQLMFYAVTQIASKGVVSMEELRRQLGEKLPGTIQIAAKALNTIPEELEKAIRKGIVSSEKFLPIFGDALIRTFGDSAEQASTSVSASLNRLTNVWIDFVKEILDSGAGQAIANVFDAIRQKLEDPYVVERFASLVKYLGDRFTEFVSNLTAEDVRNGFDTFSNGVSVMITLVQKFIDLLQWVINNGAKAGAIAGAIGGAMLGSVAGPGGMAVGAVVGAAGGAYAGSKLAPSSADLEQRRQADAAARESQTQARLQREQFRSQILTGPLQQFKGLTSLNGLEKLFDDARLNQKTIDDLYKIASDKSFKTDAAKITALKDYAKYGIEMSPSTATLADVIGTTKPKADRSQLASMRSMESTYARAIGLNASYAKELSNLDKLLDSGKLNYEQYAAAVQDLVAKQPFAIENSKALSEAYKIENKAILENWKSYDQQFEARSKLNAMLESEELASTMRPDQLRLEHQVTQAINGLREHGAELIDIDIEGLRERFRVIDETYRVTQAMDHFLSATVDRFEPQITQVKGIRAALDDPESGATKQDATNFVVGQNEQMFQGTDEYYSYLESRAADTQSFLKLLRHEDYISQKTYDELSARTTRELYQSRVQAASDAFGQLSTLMNSSSREAFEIGKAAAIAKALIDAYGAINTTWASVPYPWNIAAVAAVGAATFANVRAISATQMPGRAAGGYTGDMPVDQIAGVHHGREFVVNANATARNRAALEAMNAGRTVNGSSDSGVTVIINNNSRGTQTRTEERQTPTGPELKVFIEDTVSESIARKGRIADTMEGQYRLERAAGLAR